MKVRENNRKRDRYGKEKYRKRDCLREKENKTEREAGLGMRERDKEIGFGQRERK